jgi:hypothetical protein
LIARFRFFTTGFDRRAKLIPNKKTPGSVESIRMFCPNCGKDNSHELKFCASCGTNLEAVSQALAGREDDFFTKMDSGIDQLVARYSEHVFRSAPQAASERKVSGSWQLLGQAVLTSLVDMLLFTLMWNLLPLRFAILVISTPFRLLSERSEAERRQKLAPAYQPPELPPQPARLWLGDNAPSVTEGTTRHLEVTVTETTESARTTDHLKEI